MKTIADLTTELQTAMARHAEVQAEESEVSRRMCEARNRLNAAQKAFDVAVADMRANAPWNSDWHQGRRGGAVPADNGTREP